MKLTLYCMGARHCKREMALTPLCQAAERRWASHWRRGTLTIAATQKVDQWRQNLRTVDCTNAWLDAVNPCDPSRRVVDLSSATFMDDISRIQIFAAPPSIAEVVFKINRAHSMLEESQGEGDWTLNASKTANVMMMREGGRERTPRPGG